MTDEDCRTAVGGLLFTLLMCALALHSYRAAKDGIPDDWPNFSRSRGELWRDFGKVVRIRSKWGFILLAVVSFLVSVWFGIVCFFD